jgi:hypothetical protein
MKTYIKFFLAVTLTFAIGMAAAGTVMAADQPIWHNFTSQAALSSGTLPSEAYSGNTAPIWQAQLNTFQKAGEPMMANQQVSKDKMASEPPFSKGIWCALAKCQ